MSRAIKASDGEQAEKLSESIDHLAQQVEVLRNSIDEIRELSRWSIAIGRGGSAAQRHARAAMLTLLDGGLFGFVEPDPIAAEL